MPQRIGRKAFCSDECKAAKQRPRVSGLRNGETKSGQGRKAIVTDEVFDLVKPLVEAKQPKDLLSRWRNGSQVLDFRVSWRKMCNAAKVSVLLHDLRSSAVR